MSSAQQRESHTIESQLRVVPDFCRRQGWEVVETYVDDGRSAAAGKLEFRDGFKRLLRDASAGRFDVVAVVALDRMTRSDDLRERGDILETFRSMRVGIAETSTGTLHDLRSTLGVLLVNLQADQAAKEREKIIERTMRGAEQAALRGHKPRGKTPYGLFWSLDRKAWSEHPEEAAIVREIYQRVCAGESAKSVGRELDRRGVKPPRTGRWETAIWRLVAKSTYRGRWVADGKRGHVVEVPALVSDAVWYAAQEAVRRGALRGLRRTRHVYLCERIAVCGSCGSPVWTYREPKATANGRAYYVCKGRRMPRPGERCEAPFWRVAEVDERVWQAIAGVLATPRHALLERLLGRRVRDDEDARLAGDDAAAARAQLDQLAQAEAAILDRFAQGLISEPAMDLQVKRTAARRALLEEQVRSADRVRGRARRRAVTLDALDHALAELRGRLDETTPEERRALVRMLVPGEGRHVVTLGADGGIGVGVCLGRDAGALSEPCEGASTSPLNLARSQARTLRLVA